MSAHRQSALVLHGLAEEDQRWMLARLAPEDRRVVGEHLTELRSLGIPADPALIDAATRDESTTAMASSGRDIANPLYFASAVQMHAVLAGEPLWLVQRVLALGDWPWKQEFLAALTPGQRERLKAQGETQTAVQKNVSERLLAQLSMRLGGVDLSDAPDRAVQATHGFRFLLLQATRRSFSTVHRVARR